MHHFVYKTINQKNGKIYVGKHSTFDLNDNYLGSGSGLRKAINKHGFQNFKREIIYLCASEDEACQIERQIVTPEFCQRDDTYNINRANQTFTWTGMKRPEQVDVMRKAEPWKFKKDQCGVRNPAYGKPAHNRKPLVAERGTEIIMADSIKDMARKLGVGRAAIRANVQGKAKNRYGWNIRLIK